MTISLGWRRLLTAVVIVWLTAVGGVAGYSFWELTDKAKYELSYQGQPMTEVVVSRAEAKSMTEQELKEKMVRSLAQYQGFSAQNWPASVDSLYREYVERKWPSLAVRYGVLAIVPPLVFVLFALLAFWVVAGFKREA